MPSHVYPTPLLGDVMLHPYGDTVSFSSGKHEWAFRLSDFVTMLAHDKNNLFKSKLMTRLWGDQFYDPTTNKWTKVREIVGEIRAFNGLEEKIPDILRTKP
ncbi:hypothetical protein CTI12_AA070370 [Artemisia annua]|uniref:Uncharacterized protein n=1 Tax=Artemisia annua TaxID=35608 RepID=A0A2U1Q5U0_ARTAN|nr:hypothetical protein CTI12_AA070370 [Artemisia annua]